jgi:hypothetical protein
MRTTPIVNSHAPPTYRLFGAVFASKSRCSAHLGGTHQPGRAITPLDGRCVGDVVAQSVQSLLNPLLTAMGIPDFNRLETMPTLVFNDTEYVFKRCRGLDALLDILGLAVAAQAHVCSA